MLDDLDSNDRVVLSDEYLPKAGKGAIPIIDRDSVFATIARREGDDEIGVLDEQSVVDLLSVLLKREGATFSVSRSKENEQHAAQIVANIGYLPLAIWGAASLILNNSCPLPDFEVL